MIADKFFVTSLLSFCNTFSPKGYSRDIVRV